MVAQQKLSMRRDFKIVNTGVFVKGLLFFQLLLVPVMKSRSIHELYRTLMMFKVFFVND